MSKNIILKEIINDFSRYIIDKYTKDFKKEKIVEIYDTDSDTDSEPANKLEEISYKAIVNINLKKLSNELVSEINISYLTKNIMEKMKLTDKKKKDLIKRLYSRLKNASLKVLKLEKEFKIDPDISVSGIKDRISKKFFDLIYSTGIERQIDIVTGEDFPINFILIQLILAVIVCIAIFYLYEYFLKITIKKRKTNIGFFNS